MRRATAVSTGPFVGFAVPEVGKVGSDMWAQARTYARKGLGGIET